MPAQLRSRAFSRTLPDIASMTPEVTHCVIQAADRAKAVVLNSALGAGPPAEISPGFAERAALRAAAAMSRGPSAPRVIA